VAVITTYATLVQSILDFTHRGTVSPYVDYFIQSAQEKINDDVFAENEGNGIRMQEAPFAGTITTGTIGVPGDWLAPKLLDVVDASGNRISTLSFISTQQMYTRYPNRQASGIPAYIAREGANFIFGPFPDAGYNVAGIYYAAAPLLTSAAPTNWMVTQTPNLLLAACLIKAARFLKDPDALGMWQQEYTDKLGSLILRDKAERWSGGTLAIQPA
jgi:hypothetical protein